MTTKALNREQMNERGRKATSKIAMTVILVSFSMLFACLMLGYALYRFTSDAWPPMGMDRLPLDLPTIATVIIGLSSLFYHFAETAYNAKKLAKSRIFFALSAVFGFGFLVNQVLFWNEMKELGYLAETGIFASLTYAFTWTHAAHIAGGLIALVTVIPALLGDADFSKDLRFQNVGMFWHFLGVVWLLIYVSVFVI